MRAGVSVRHGCNASDCSRRRARETRVSNILVSRSIVAVGSAIAASLGMDPSMSQGAYRRVHVDLT